MNKDVLQFPAEFNTRQEICTVVKETIASRGIQNPVTQNDIIDYALEIIKRKSWQVNWQAYIGLQISNELWRDTVLGIKTSKRLLLLPTDTHNTNCTSILELACSNNITTINIDDKNAVSKAICSTKYQAIIAIGDFEILHKGWQKISALGIPVIAFVLHNNKLEDISWVEDFLHIKNISTNNHFDFNTARHKVNTWFSKENLDILFNSNFTETENLGISWVATAGKRWRPLLAYYVYTILSKDKTSPDSIKKVALAVECFHKASLIHDDIEDNDDERYGQDTMHTSYGVPIALNVGDYLIGEGYRMLANSTFDNAKIQRMVKVSADGHRDLSLGQGEELSWMRTPTTINLKKVINIFKLKTSPAFEVALCLGAIAGGADDSQCKILKKFSNALGIAFQIRDDMLDFFGDDGGADIAAMRPSALLAMVRQECDKNISTIIDNAWQSKTLSQTQQVIIQNEAKRLNLQPKAIKLLNDYKTQAINHLNNLKNKELQNLLSLVISKIV